MIEGNELLRRVNAEPGLAAQAVDPADHAMVEVGVESHGVVHPAAVLDQAGQDVVDVADRKRIVRAVVAHRAVGSLSLIHISEPTRLLSISYAVFCLKKKK